MREKRPDAGSSGRNRQNNSSRYERDTDKPRYAKDGRRSYGQSDSSGRTAFNRSGGYGHAQDSGRFGRAQDGGRFGRAQDGGRFGHAQDGGRFGHAQDDGKSGRTRDGEKPAYRRNDDDFPARTRVQAPFEPQQPAEVPEDEAPLLIMGRNAVREAIKSGRSIDRILVVAERDGSLNEVVALARDRNIVLREVSRKKLDELCMPFGHGGRTGNHQGIVAQVPSVEYCTVADVLACAKERNEQPFVILLDGIEDPHNLGSIIRSAECAGAHGVVIPKRRSAAVTAAAAKASAGATEYMRVARVVNLSGAIDELKAAGLWILGADMAGSPMTSVDMKGPLALVIGSEGSGLSRLVREKCDYLAAIPLYGNLQSLNASVAAAILMYEKKRQDS